MVLLSATDTELPVVVTTFGVMEPVQPRDWRWMCDDITGATLISAFEVLPDGTWLLGTSTGLWRSLDHCAWQRASAPLDALSITRLAKDGLEPRRIWASSSTSGQANALWYSDDSGRTFSAWKDFGEGTTIRGFWQGPSGSPVVAIVRWNGLPFFWYTDSPAGSSQAEWISHAVPSAENESIYLLGIDVHDPQVSYLRRFSADSDVNTLVRATSSGDFEDLLSLPGSLDAFASGPARQELWAGGRASGLYRSTDGGRSWSGPDFSLEAGCLYTYGDRRYQCTNNYTDGVSVVQTDLSTGATSDVLWFGDVHQPIECPAGTQMDEICAPYWETVKVTAQLDLSEVPTPAPVLVLEGGGCLLQAPEATSASPRPAGWPGSLVLLTLLAAGMGWGRTRP